MTSTHVVPGGTASKVNKLIAILEVDLPMRAGDHGPFAVLALMSTVFAVYDGHNVFDEFIARRNIENVLRNTAPKYPGQVANYVICGPRTFLAYLCTATLYNKFEDDMANLILIDKLVRRQHLIGKKVPHYSRIDQILRKAGFQNLED